MRALYKHHIVDLFVLVDDTLPKEIKRGARSVLSNSELMTILVWDGVVGHHRNLSSVYDWIKRDYADCFPKLPAYQNFVAHCHRLLPTLLWLLESLLVTDAPLRFADSTMLPVCRLIRAKSHKVAKSVAQYGKNWQGWHYGFKLHAAIDHQSRLAALVFTPASEHDNQHMEQLMNQHTKLLVGDSHYGGSVMRKRLWRKYRAIVIAPPHHTQRKTLATDWQMLLLHMRPKIEATFGKLKEHMHLVSSFPRSIRGYFVHYVRVLLGYQVGRVNS
jgi:hypothetical protein